MDSVRAVEATIRTYERRDAAGVADVFYRSVREVALSDYTAEQVKAWVPGRWDAEQEHRRSGDGQRSRGKRLLEKHMARSKGAAYANYVRRTSGFFPWPPCGARS
jgi:hypothetical protein